MTSWEKLPFNVGKYGVSVKIRQESKTLLMAGNALFFSVGKGFFYNTGNMPWPQKKIMIEQSWMSR